MIGRTAIAAVLVLAGCGGDPVAPALPGTSYTAFQGSIYPVRRIADEPTPDLTSPDIITLEDGGRAVPPGSPFITTGPAIRVGDVVARQTATDVLATYCQQRGISVAPGWRDVIVRFDDVTAEHVFYIDC